jgi:guanylate kinase
MLYIISGPSGCGKSTLVRSLLSNVPQITFSVSHTTRPRRAGEEDGTDYHFVDSQEFQRLIDDGRMAEWAVVHGHRYGTSKLELEKKSAGNMDVVLDIDIQGARQIREKHKKGLFIFILPPSFAELKKRLETRGKDSQDVIRDRLYTARKEIRAYTQFDYVIVNDSLEAAQRELESIVLSERCRLKIKQKSILPILRSFSESE